VKVVSLWLLTCTEMFNIKRRASNYPTIFGTQYWVVQALDYLTMAFQLQRSHSQNHMRRLYIYKDLEWDAHGQFLSTILTSALRELRKPQKPHQNSQ